MEDELLKKKKKVNTDNLIYKTIGNDNGMVS